MIQSEYCPNYINGMCRCGKESCDMSFEECCIDCEYDNGECNRNRECGE